MKNLTVKWSQRITITRSAAIDWRVSGEAPVTVLNGQQVPNSQFYAHLVKNGGEIKPSNLSESHSQICLAGRGVGEARTRDCITNIRFENDGCEADLSQLLTVQGWMPGTVSRVMFYNARTEEFDRQRGKPQVVIADGDTSFLRVVDGKDFEYSDVVGVIHRTMERDKLEAIGTKLENLRQWYDHSVLRRAAATASRHRDLRVEKETSMPVTASRLFDFLEERSSCSIERHVIASAAFGDLRRSLRSMIVSLSDSGEWDATEISDRLRSVLSEWLTVPVQFDSTVLLALREIGEPAAVESRWGRDFRGHYDDACRTAQELLTLENPVRTTLMNILQALQEKARSFHIFCHRRSREHFESLCAAAGVAFPEDVFIHSVTEYREAEPFDVLLKVGPLRSRGWGSAPDALLTAPRFDTLVQVVWSGCSDEPSFGYDPVSATLHEADAAHNTGAATDQCMRNLQLKWKVQETCSRDNSIGRYDQLPDIDEFEVFTKLRQPDDLQRATLVQVDEGHGILYPPHSRVLGLDTVTNSVDYCLPGETLLEGMFLILPLVDDARLAGLQAEDGYFSTTWKEKLNAEYRSDPVTLENRLWDAGLELLHLRERIAHWCKPPSTVIHAPQSIRHFEILIKVLGLDFDPNEPAQGRRGAWWQFAWDEIRRARGEAIQTGFHEQQIVDEQLLAALGALDAEIRVNTGQQAFQLAFHHSQTLHGVFKFYKVLAVEEGFQAPPGELKTLCELRRIDQWRV